MKKYLLMLFGIVSFLGINSVKADTIDYEYIYYNFETGIIRYSNSGFTDFISNSTYTFEDIDSLVEELILYWEETYKDNGYPYYAIYVECIVNNTGHSNSGSYDYAVALEALSSPITNFSDYKEYMSGQEKPFEFTITSIKVKDGVKTYYNSYIQPISPLWSVQEGYDVYNLAEHSYLPFAYYDSNFDMYYDLEDTARIIKDEVVIGTYNNGDLFPTYKQLFNLQSNGYTTIDLNDYSYVVLSLKDYSNVPSDNSTYTNIYVQGQLCLTPVYHYGSTERNEIFSNTQVQRCSSYYDQETALRTYILQSDVRNHAIYYIKSYNTSKTNIIRVDSSFFDISYITQENEDNPIAVIDGKNYPILSYSSLTDTATKSEDEGYISGVSCSLGDINCADEFSDNFFDNLFNGDSDFFESLIKNPIKFLKNIFTSLKSLMSVIFQFISLLPEAMQSFFYLTFFIAVILGIIKIIL